MGRRQKAFNEFIDGIADEKLEGLSKQAGTIASDDNYRLDMQGVRDWPRFAVSYEKASG